MRRAPDLGLRHGELYENAAEYTQLPWYHELSSNHPPGIPKL